MVMFHNATYCINLCIIMNSRRMGENVDLFGAWNDFCNVSFFSQMVFEEDGKFLERFL
jgi:hypothetical protein